MDNPTTENPVEKSKSQIAKEIFGANYHGEVSETPVETQPEAPEAPEEEVETEEPRQVAEDTDESLEAADDDVVSTFDELVQTQEWDPEWANNLQIKVKVDGEERPVKLADLRASYQMNQAAEKRLEEAKQKSQAINQELAEKQERVNQTFATAQELIGEVEKSLKNDFAKVDWDKLKEQDPADYAAKKLDMQERAQHLESLKKNARDKWEKAVAQHQEEANKALVETLQVEGQKLLEKIPEWKDEEAAKTGKQAVSKYLAGMGFSEQEISQAYDHRLIEMAYKAMQYEQGQKNLEPAKKKLKKVVKSLPPGGKKSTSQTNQEQYLKLAQRARQTGKLEDAFAAQKARKGLL